MMTSRIIYPFSEMRLPFHFQFMFAPVTIIVLLACLVAYTLTELPRINREIEISRQWNLVTDRALVMNATAVHIDQLARRMAASPGKRDELLFDYIEQTQIYLDHAQQPELLALAPQDIRRIIMESTLRLHNPERVDPNNAHTTLSTLLPALEQLSAGFQSQKRIALFNYHHNSPIIVTRLINTSLAVLFVCIVLGISLTTWGLRATRRRLTALTQLAQRVCAGDLTPHPTPTVVRDELDKLDQCLATMTQRLINTMAVEKVLQGTEEERRRIAMDMHDGVLTDLTTLSRALDHAESTSMPNKAPPLSELRMNVIELAESIRRVIEDLHPQSLEILGIEAALRSLLARHCSGPGQPVYHFEFDPDAENALRPAQKIHLFRIASEAIHNILRHAHCSRFEVSIRVVAQRLVCTVEDNGIGMSANHANLGHGCINIAERARVIGAQAGWNNSRFSTGTRFELSLPLLPEPSCPA